MQEGTKMIYDAMDALQRPVENGWTKTIDKLEKEIARLLRALQAKDEKIADLNRALWLACSDIHEQVKMDAMAYDGCSLAVIVGHNNSNCCGDCDECLPKHYTEQVDLAKYKIVADEIEGRKRMDAEDQEKEIKKI